MKKVLENWNTKVISLLDKRIYELMNQTLELTRSQKQRRLELLNNLKSVIEISSKESFIYQKDKLDRTIEILNKRYADWINGNIDRKENSKSRSIYNTEVGLNHLRRQRRNLVYILELDKK